MNRLAAVIFILSVSTGSIYAEDQAEYPDPAGLKILVSASQAYGIEAPWTILLGFKLNVGIEFGNSVLGIYLDPGYAVVPNVWTWCAEAGVRLYWLTVDYSASWWTVARSSAGPSYQDWHGLTRNIGIGLQIPVYSELYVWIRAAKNLYLDIDAEDAWPYLINLGWSFEIRFCGKQKFVF